MTMSAVHSRPSLVTWVCILQGALALFGLTVAVIGGAMVVRTMSMSDMHGIGGASGGAMSAAMERVMVVGGMTASLLLGMLVGVVGAWRMREWGRITMIVIAWGMIVMWAVNAAAAVLLAPLPGPTKFPEVFQLLYWLLLIIVLRTELVRAAFARAKDAGGAGAVPSSIPPAATYS